MLYMYIYCIFVCFGIMLKQLYVVGQGFVCGTRGLLGLKNCFKYI
ncbi:hypothetical protein [Plasmodium yoelii yoelii]|uniref:Uncharacterized protein n=1 Tax=Plasmodium yoelii yoelii TaxID=73239 RepID=Q7RNW9_PLAYO|nr:hypothetical protein [Plasmodium yoelii yoelii]